MNENYLIQVEDGRFFGGWNRLGIMIIKPESEKNLAYRMNGTVAKRNLYKVEEFTRKHCFVVPC